MRFTQREAEELEAKIHSQVTSDGWNVFKSQVTTDGDLTLSVDQGTQDTRKATYLTVRDEEQILRDVRTFIINPIPRQIERRTYSRVG